jgi:hypothetical protein
MHRAVSAAVATAALVCLLASTACSAPPQKEIDRAQGAIDAARAAGAAQYAREPFTAATTAMQETHEAVAQRDYRLALSRAIDANERALEAARQAANGKARARGEAEAAVAWVSTALRELDERLKAAEAGGVTARESEPARSVREDAGGALQEARATIEQGDYAAVTASAKVLAERMTVETRNLNEIIDAKTARGARRRR